MISMFNNYHSESVIKTEKHVIFFITISVWVYVSDCALQSSWNALKRYHEWNQNSNIIRVLGSNSDWDNIFIIKLFTDFKILINIFINILKFLLKKLLYCLPS